jgi:DNA-binding XRE family transcriptional regulator
MLNRAKPFSRVNQPNFPEKTTRNRVSRLQKLRIMQKSCLGLSQTEIAKTEGLARESVNRIVNHSPEAEQFKDEMRLKWFALCEPAIECVRRKLESDDEDAVDIAFLVLATCGVIEPEIVVNRPGCSSRSQRPL